MDGSLRYMEIWTVKGLPITKYLLGKPAGAPANEQAWKDTIQAFPGEATMIRARFAPIGGEYPFDPRWDQGTYGTVTSWTTRTMR